MIDERGAGWDKGGKYEGFDVQSFTIGQSGKFRRLNGIVKALGFMRARRTGSDILHVHGGYYMSLLLAWLAKLLLGIKTVLKVTSDEWDTPDGVEQAKYGGITSHFYRALDGVVTMTDGLAQKCRNWGYAGQLVIIPNGVDCELFKPLGTVGKHAMRKKLGLDPEGRIIVYVGWMGYGKGTDVLFKSWSRLGAEFKGLRLLCVGNYHGDTDTPEKLANFLEEHGLDPGLAKHPELKCIGPVDNVHEYLQASDIFLFPSRREGFGTVQVEAMASGLPCVVNDLKGVSSDILPDPAVGFRIEGNDVEQISELVMRLLNDAALCDEVGLAARDRACCVYAHSVVTDQYVEFYRRLLND